MSGSLQIHPVSLFHVCTQVHPVVTLYITPELVAAAGSRNGSWERGFVSRSAMRHGKFLQFQGRPGGFTAAIREVHLSPAADPQ